LKTLKIKKIEKNEKTFGEKSCQVVENQNKNEKKEKNQAKKSSFRDASTYVDTCISLIYQGLADNMAAVSP